MQLYSTDNANQKEKHEANLKTEIKKLQKLRDQIKTWLAGNEIKDKTALSDARRDIERRMEKFKVCEKEAKTKAFSKEGLQAAASRLDPREKAKQEMREWLNNTVDTLNTQVEEFEAEVEDLSGAAPKGKKAKPPPRVAHLEESMARHRQHITRLEQMLRLLDNDEITAEDVEGVKELVEDYQERNQDDPDEFSNPDDLYGDVLDALQGMSEAVVAAPPSHAKAAKDREARLEKEREEKERERQKAAALAAKAQLAALGNTRLLSEAEDDKSKAPSAPPAMAAASAAPKVSVVPVPTPAAPTPITAPATAAAVVAAGAPPPPPPPPPPPARPAGPKEPASPVVAQSGPGTPVRGQLQGAGGPPAASPLTPTPAAGPLGQQEAFPALGAAPNGAKPRSPSAASIVAGTAPKQAQAQQPVGPAIGPADAGLETAPSMDGGAMDGGLEQLTAQLGSMGIQDDAAGPALTPQQTLQLLQAAAPRSVPLPSDSNWQLLQQRPRLPPVPPPASYPAQRLPTFDNPALYEKLDPETLFFAFYQQPGSLQQYLAARSLKQQAWRFHKQHGAWFQRHEEPKAGGQPGDDWEQGTYVYFDQQFHESEGGEAPTGWCYRLKNDFLFQYKALEDELVV